MYGYSTLLNMSASAMKQQQAVRMQTFAPDDEKLLRPFSSWEVCEFILKIHPSMLRRKLREDKTLPSGVVDEGGRMHWYTLEEVNLLRKRIKPKSGTLMPERPNGRALRVGISNFKGGVGKTTVALHMAHAAALDGYKVLCIDFDPQATLTHSMGLSAVEEESTVWGIMCRDLCTEADRITEKYDDPDDCPYPSSEELPANIQTIGENRPADFIRKTCWRTIDIIPSCSNAAFVEFASAQYRAMHPAWTFFGCVSRFLDELPDDQYDMVIFDCPPAIGYQSLNAAFAADILYVPTGPGYWEYDSTASYLSQLGDAMQDIEAGLSESTDKAALTLPKEFLDVKVLLTRYESSNALHKAMFSALEGVFGEKLCKQAINLTRSVEQSGRFQQSIYERDYREMTRETWKNGRTTFDAAYAEFKLNALSKWREFPTGNNNDEPISERSL